MGNRTFVTLIVLMLCLGPLVQAMDVGPEGRVVEDHTQEPDPSLMLAAPEVTVQDEHDGSLSGSTFREARSWGKVETAREQVVYAEATLVFR